VERPKVSSVSDTSDTGHPWAAGRRAADHFSLWLEVLRRLQPEKINFVDIRTSSQCSIAGVLMYATFNDFGAKCKYCYFNNYQKRLRRPFLEKKPVERPKVSGLSEISDTGHSWAADRRPADHFGLWLEALR
jgi:hypothetical protein